MSLTLLQALNGHMQGANTQALNAYTQLLGAPLAWLGLGVLAWQQGEKARAWGYLERGWGLDHTLSPWPSEWVGQWPHAFARDWLEAHLDWLQVQPSEVGWTRVPSDLATWPWLEDLLCLGQQLQQMGFSTAAQQCYARLRQDPLYCGAAELALGHLFLPTDTPRAIAHYQRALEHVSDPADIHFHLARIYHSLGQPADANLHYQGALSQPNPLWALHQQLYLPPVMPEMAPLTQLHTQLAEVLEQWDTPILLTEHLDSVARFHLETLFDLNYQTEADRPLKEAYARCFTVPDWEPPVRARGARLRVGVLVTPGHEGIFLVGSEGLIQQLSHIDWVMIGFPDSLRGLRQHLGTAARYLPISAPLLQAIDVIRAADLDLLYFWECGTDPINYFLGHFRLAPVQFTSWGTAATTGLTTMDYFLTTALAEGPAAQAGYTETLLFSPVLHVWYPRQELLPSALTRPDFGFEPQQHIYLCPHNLLKLHPSFDPYLGELARRDPQARVVLVGSRFSAWTEAVRQRLLRHFDQAEQLQILPRMNPADFLALLRAADVALDTPVYGAGKLAFECAAMGVPMVTHPGRWLRSRLGLACAEAMEVKDMVADSWEAYLDKARHWAEDREARAAVEHKLKASSDRLFERPEALQAFAALIEQMAL